MRFKNFSAVLTKQKQRVSLYELEIPEIPPGYVLLKMMYSGICHTQLNEISGILGKDKFLPHCIGHEGVGKVITAGPRVKNLKKGNIVVVSWIKKKSKKKYIPITYKFRNKTINTGGCNTFSDYSIVSDNRIFKINI